MSEREWLLETIEAEKERMIDFFQGFVQQASPNPPGDTTDAVRYITDFLEGEGAPHRLVAPQPVMANVVGTIEGPTPGRHLVLNGHIDVFPVGEVPADEGWTTDPWGGEIKDGTLYGRGASDMKAGTSASIWTYVILNRIRDKLKGKLTLTCVSDEETFGPWGARWLMENEPEVRGDCCLNGEPSSTYSVRYGEKGPLWLTFTVKTPGAHGAYTHASPSATRLAMDLIKDLETLEELDIPAPDNLMRAQMTSREASDRAMGPGAADVLPKVTLNIGTINGGLKNNMIPHTCTFEADIRLPVGSSREQVLAEVEKILARHPNATMVEDMCNPPSWCDPYGEMMEIIQNTVESLGRSRPTPIVSIGGTDARLWRYEGIPAYVYGPSPTGMGSFDERVPIDDFLHIVRTHVLASYEYLMAS
ncbi:M20/M25/M40 family metallo-hydrolase [Rhodobacteraceae bacterium NNCM2]|nr:M20/M25/M40 family metallo-hydrolase [Coraliihabitans acroporae]